MKEKYLSKLYGKHIAEEIKKKQALRDYERNKEFKEKSKLIEEHAKFLKSSNPDSDDTECYKEAVKKIANQDIKRDIYTIFDVTENDLK